jgi:hypothetical protein
MSNRKGAFIAVATGLILFGAAKVGTAQAEIPGEEEPPKYLMLWCNADGSQHCGPGCTREDWDHGWCCGD